MTGSRYPVSSPTAASSPTTRSALSEPGTVPPSRHRFTCARFTPSAAASCASESNARPLTPVAPRRNPAPSRARPRVAASLPHDPSRLLCVQLARDVHNVVGRDRITDASRPGLAAVTCWRTSRSAPQCGPGAAAPRRGCESAHRALARAGLSRARRERRSAKNRVSH
jgi:hypothetical protein